MTDKKLVSECCGADAYMAKAFYERCNPWHIPLERRCKKCHKLCEVEEREKGDES